MYSPILLLYIVNLNFWLLCIDTVGRDTERIRRLAYLYVSMLKILNITD